jgi:3-oxoacyl-[acyl-carrier protein] reductase
MVRTWTLEMRKSGVCVNAVVPVAATAMTKTVPYFAAAVAADEAGEPMPDFFRKEIGFGTADDVAGLIVFLASDGAAGVNGQVIGAGGDRIQVWSHPEPVLNLFHDGGWSADDLAQAKDQLLNAAQSVGEKFPALPENLQTAPVGR